MSINVQAAAAKAYHNIALDVNKVTSLFHNELPYSKAQAIEQKNTYDYVVVVGSVDNGSIVANKIASKDTLASILLLEGGTSWN